MYLLSLLTKENDLKVVITRLVCLFVPDRRPDVGSVEYGSEVERKLHKNPSLNDEEILIPLR